MTIKYGFFSTKQTSQSQTEPIPFREHEMKQNAAGGWGFKISPEQMLERFLILGTVGGTYYVSQKKLTKEAVEHMREWLENNVYAAIEIIENVSKGNRAISNEPSVFMLAYLACLLKHAENNDLQKNRSDRLHAVYETTETVIRTASQLFQFVAYCEDMRGWGMGLRKAIARFYLTLPLEKLTNQVLKYRQRDNWTHRDLLRVAHPKTDNSLRNSLFKYIVKKDIGVLTIKPEFRQAFAFHELQTLDPNTEVQRAVDMIEANRLNWELVPDAFLAKPEVWGALLNDMPYMATVRNLGRMSANGLIQPFNEATLKVLRRLSDEDQLKKSRMHPVQILAALLTYKEGRGLKGSLKWNVQNDIVAALENAFHNAFNNVEPTGKKLLLALDISGSMSAGGFHGMPNLNCAQAGALMTLVQMATEPNTHVIAFDEKMQAAGISKNDSVSDVLNKFKYPQGGGTDCSAPIQYAINNKLDMDAIIIYTDGETWLGQGHPTQWMNTYRQVTGNDHTKLISVAMTATETSIVDNDPRHLNVVGMDTNVPQVIHNFLIE